MIAKVKSTPWKFVIYILHSSPKQIWQIILGQKIKPLNDAKIFHLIKNGHSFVRWGDGETAIARGKFAWYQKFDTELQNSLVSLLHAPPKNTIFGIPWAVHAKPYDVRWNIRIFKIIFSTRVFIIKNLKNSTAEKINFSTQDFWWRNSGNLRQILTELLENKECIIVASNKEYLSFCPPKTKFIHAPSINAYSDYAKIVSDIDLAIKNFSHRPVILCAIGPTTKALVTEFQNKCQVLDIGHGFNFALNGNNVWAWSKQ
jgi:hypothetical protein